MKTSEAGEHQESRTHSEVDVDVRPDDHVGVVTFSRGRHNYFD